MFLAKTLEVNEIWVLLAQTVVLYSLYSTMYYLWASEDTFCV